MLSRLAQNLDLIAILVLALMLGVAETPKLHFQQAGWQDCAPQFRILHAAPELPVVQFFR